MSRKNPRKCGVRANNVSRYRQNVLDKLNRTVLEYADLINGTEGVDNDGDYVTVTLPQVIAMNAFPKMRSRSHNPLAGSSRRRRREALMYRRGELLEMRKAKKKAHG